MRRKTKKKRSARLADRGRSFAVSCPACPPYRGLTFEKAAARINIGNLEVFCFSCTCLGYTVFAVDDLLKSLAFLGWFFMMFGEPHSQCLPRARAESQGSSLVLLFGFAATCSCAFVPAS